MANNPINAIDPDGREIVIVHRNSSLKYENGKLYNENGSRYTGRVSGFLQKTLNALGKISQSGEGLNMITTLESSNNTFKIKEGSSQFNESNRYKAYANQIETDPQQSRVKDLGLDLDGGSGGVIQWNTSGIPIQTKDGMKRDAVIDLAHEMFHALDANNGMLDDRRESGVKRSEWQATYRENILRKELGKPLRTNYRHSIDENGIKRGIEPSMLDSSNKNVKPVWY
ncbi:M91 family zinc metallopeptidase [Myroides sp. WP-1]|uniref:M91 family zinc metallopeptidase n=1 Tax=Myroides sp. WP-1 TaxID=2759944 RepID=UPI00351C4D44